MVKAFHEVKDIKPRDTQKSIEEKCKNIINDLLNGLAILA